MVFAFNEDKSKATVIPVESGGTGATTASTALSNLGAAPALHKHSAGDITNGTLSISKGGTGATTALAALSNLHVKGDILYSNVSGTSGTITLSKSIENYDYMFVYFYTTSKRTSSTKFDLSGSSIFVLNIAYYEGATTFTYRSTQLTVSGKTVSTSYGGQAWINGANSCNALNLTNAIGITKIEGFQY